jgi:Holliday junction resolvase RusA-like endonuclease
MSIDDSTRNDGAQALSQTIFDEPASKANSRRVVRYGGMSRLIKSEKALTYSESFKRQCKRCSPLLSCDVRVTLHIYYASRRPDLDESLILDLLQDFVYINDRQVKEKHIYWHLDPVLPRTDILIEPMEDVAPKKKALTKRKQGEG